MSKLSEIAAAMRQAVAAKPFGWTSTTLPGDLDIILSHDGEKWRLALRREKVYPSATEAQICAPLFQVAAGTEPERRQKTTINLATGRKITWRSIEFNWSEV